MNYLCKVSAKEDERTTWERERERKRDIVQRICHIWSNTHEHEETKREKRRKEEKKTTKWSSFRRERPWKDKHQL